MPNQNISDRASILDGSSTGITVYQETHSVTTNGLGLFNISTGSLNQEIVSFTLAKNIQ
jgi:hypothetical protein